jgi:hypothetical protein
MMIFEWKKKDLLSLVISRDIKNRDIINSVRSNKSLEIFL